MARSRFLGPIDFGIISVLVVFVVLPPRRQYAAAVVKDDFKIALAEARTLQDPNNGEAIDALTHALDEDGQKDWAIDFSVGASERMKTSPTRWRALIAASTALVDRFDVKPGLDYANRAISACDSARATDPASCSDPEKIRLQLYQQSLEAGVKSGADPRLEHKKFLAAEEGAVLTIHLDRHDADRGSGAAPDGSGTPPSP
jgi:hypothetical protein